MSYPSSYDIYDRESGGFWDSCLLCGGPGFGRNGADLLVGHCGQPGEYVEQIGIWLDSPPAAAFDNCIKDGGTLSGLSIAEEEPVLFAYRRGPDRILDQIVVDLDSTIA